jgi:hypothetical protein
MLGQAIRNHGKKAGAKPAMSRFAPLLAAVMLLVPTPSRSATVDPRRGVWFESSGLLAKNIGPTIENMKRLHVNSVHVVISSPITDMGLFANCKAHSATLRQAHNCAAQKYVFNFDRWVTKPGRATLPDFIGALQAQHMSVYLMIWPIPTAQYVQSLDKLVQFVRRHPVDGIELEDEENWSPEYIDGFKTNNEAAVAMISYLRNNVPPSVRVGVTTAPRNFSINSFKNDLMVQQADFLSFQTYQNVCSSGGDHCNVTKLSNQYAAGQMQDRGLNLIRQLHLRPGAGVILGLPAYDQSIFPNSGEVNMFRALAHAVCHEIGAHSPPNLTEYAYWSQNNINTRRGDAAYARRFLANCNFDAVRQICNGNLLNDVDTVVRACPGIAK